MHAPLDNSYRDNPWGNYGEKLVVVIIIHDPGVRRIVIFSANKIRNRFSKPTSVQIGVGIVCVFQNLQI